MEEKLDKFLAYLEENGVEISGETAFKCDDGIVLFSPNEGGGVDIAVFYRYDVPGGPHGGNGRISQKVISVFGGTGGIRASIGRNEKHIRICFDDEFR